MSDPSKAPCFKVFDKCCCCIDLKAGAHVLGIFSIIGAVFGVIEIIVFFAHPSNFSYLAFATLGLCYLFPAIAYGMMLKETNEETKERFALWYLLGTGAGCTGYWIFFLVYGAIAISFITYAL